MAGNPAFIDQAAFSFMKEVNREFTFIWTVITPFISMLQGKSKNFNNQRYKKPGGLYMGTPVGLSDLATPAYPETFANQGTPATFVKTNGATQATYFYATYKQFIWLTNQEQTELEDKSTSFADIATYKTEQLKTSGSRLGSTRPARSRTPVLPGLGASWASCIRCPRPRTRVRSRSRPMPSGRPV